MASIGLHIEKSENGVVISTLSNNDNPMKMKDLQIIMHALAPKPTIDNSMLAYDCPIDL